MALRLLTPEESINISLAQSKRLYNKISTIKNFPEIKRIFVDTLNDLQIPELFNELTNIRILNYPYSIINLDENIEAYSFAVLEGQKGESLDNKQLTDQHGQVIQSPYILPMDSPFIVLGRINENPQYRITSIAHELCHILISEVENNDALLATLVKMVPINLQAMEPEEAFCIIFEAKVLKRLFNGQEIVEYLLDRYVKNDIDEDDPYLHDIKAIVGSVSTI